MASLGLGTEVFPLDFMSKRQQLVRLRKREPILIQMEILASLFASPKGPTRLAQSCNIQYARLQNFTGPMLAKGLVESATVDGEQRFSITDAGYKLYKDWLEIWRRLPLA